jgi:hypothetical protein
MLNTTTYQLPISLIQESLGDHLEICRLLAAAIVNRAFCQLLLEEPFQALQQGYQGETFLLSSEESDLILSIQAASLTEFASALVLTLGERPQDFVTTPAQANKY